MRFCDSEMFDTCVLPWFSLGFLFSSRLSCFWSLFVRVRLAIAVETGGILNALLPFSWCAWSLVCKIWQDFRESSYDSPLRKVFYYPYAKEAFSFFDEQVDSPRSSFIPPLVCRSLLLCLLFAGPWWFRGFNRILPLFFCLLLPWTDKTC